MEYREADTTIGIGDRVRSYDFESREDCYMEGIVYGYQHIEGCRRYAIQVERRVVANEERLAGVGETIYPPVNGTPTTMSLSPVTNGVVKV